MARRLRQLSPLTLLAVLVVVSLATRVALLGEPCRTPCRSASDHILIFDESYYVNAARVIAGLQLPSGTRYAGTPAGDDPNAEHPQLAKLIIAGSIELFGDGPFAWRIGSVLFGTLALLGLFVLVRAAGGSDRLALGACALMVCDNLLLVHGRIATLDIYVLAPMLWAAAFYLRGHPLAAGALIAVAACFKLVGPYVLVVLVVLELLRRIAGRGTGASFKWRPLASCTAMAVVVFFALLAILDQIAPPYDAAAGKPVNGGPFGHLIHMLTYGAAQTSPQGPTGIASYPWQWLVDLKPIVYLNINPAQPSPGLYHIHPAAHFLGMINPLIMLLALPALVLAMWRSWEVVSIGVGVDGRSEPDAVGVASGGVDALCVAWFIGTFIPFVLLSLIWNRTSYLYYMVVVMPAIYIALARLLAPAPRKLLAVWVLALVIALVVMFPFTPLP